MTTKLLTPELSISEDEGTLLQGRLTADGIERVPGVVNLTITLAEQGGYVAIGNHHADAIRGVVNLALQDEFEYLAGLVRSRRIEEMLDRLDSPFGVNGLRGILKKIDTVETDKETLVATMN